MTIRTENNALRDLCHYCLPLENYSASYLVKLEALFLLMMEVENARVLFSTIITASLNFDGS
jgi:hypothetical protein